MNSLTLMILTFIGYLLAYKLYGKFLSQKIFKLDDSHVSPSQELQDGKDFVPTKKAVLFGHHFTSIAGLGPIVGPAIAIIWGWVPAVLWVLFGAIFLGAVHDFGVLIVSMRSKGKSIGDVASNIISPRVRFVFLLIMFIANLMVIAVFALIISILFDMYPSSVIPVWSSLPIAMGLGYLIYQKKMNHITWSLVALALLYLMVVIGAYFPIKMPEVFGISPLVVWAIILLIYAYAASILPVTVLLQPRDYVNSHQLMVAIGLLVIGVFTSNPEIVAPAIDLNPIGAPEMMPFLFIIIACGAISGFHSLVGGGTTSKQCACESDSLPIGYGSMLMEGFLAILVIIAVSAGIGLGLDDGNGNILTGAGAFSSHYATWSSASGLGAKLQAFVDGASNLMLSYGMPVKISLTIVGVFLVSFAATTLDSAARIQRYIVTEFAKGFNFPRLAKPHPATAVVIGVTAVLCFHSGFTSVALRKGALALWPLFGVTNQLLATLALFAVTVYLYRRKVNIFVTLIPALFMAGMTAWGSIYNIQKFYTEGNILLTAISVISFLIEIWIIFEAVIILKNPIAELEPV